MYLNQYLENKNDSINNTNGDNSKNNKNDDGNIIIIKIIVIIIIIIMVIITIIVIINSLYQPSNFSTGFTTVAVQGNFNMEPTNQVMTTFMADNDFVNLVKSKTWFKTSTGTCIYIFLINKPKCF